MYHDSSGDRRKDIAVVPIQNMISGSSVILFGEDPGVIYDDFDDSERERIRTKVAHPAIFDRKN